MKKYILSAIFALGILISPAFVMQAEAANLDSCQSNSILQLLQAFKVENSVLLSVQSAMGTPTIGHDPISGEECTPIVLDSSNSNTTATLTVNGQSSVTGADPMDIRTWAWSGATGATSYTASADISGCDVATNDAKQPNWNPWTVVGAGVNGTASSGSAVATPGASKYGCVIKGTYTVAKDGKTTSATATITYKRANVSSPTLTITTPLTLPTATVGTPYTLTFATTGGTGALIWFTSTQASSNYGGLMWGSAGIISGTPTTAGTYKFTITVADSPGHSYAREFTLVVNPSSGASTYNLSFTKIGLGNVTTNISNTDCSGNTCSSFTRTLPNGTSVTLTAFPATGYTFTGWSGGTCSNNASTCTFLMSSAKSVTATFTAVQTNTCTDWNYSNWGACSATGIQTRTYDGSSARPAGCTGGNPVTTQNCTYTPPVVISCTGTPPPTGTGVVVNDYTTVAAGGGGIISSNTVWQYGMGSCGWSCSAPMERNGDIGCKNPAAGSGTTITLNDFSTGGKLSGIALVPQTIIGLSGAAATGLGGTNGVFTTGSDGKTPEFWLSSLGSGWTVVVVPVQGYKIRSATGCTPDVSIHANKTNNRCIGMQNGTPVTINMVPGNIATVPMTVFPKSTFSAGEYLTGTVVGGNPKDTWGCIDNPNTPANRMCDNWSPSWRQLTVPYDGHADGWHLVETNYGDTIELSPMSTAGYPAGTYTSYIKTGQGGTPSQTSSTKFTLTASQGIVTTPPPAQGTYTLTVTMNGTGIGGVHTADYTIGCGMGGFACSKIYSGNTSVILTATQNTGSTFTGWSGACSGTGTTCTVTMNQAQKVTATFTSSSVSVLNLTSLSPTSGRVGTTVTINGSGFTGTNQIYLDGIPVDTLNTSGGPTPTWISFVVPTYLPSCPVYMRSLCTDGPALLTGTHVVGVENANGSSDSLSFAVN